MASPSSMIQVGLSKLRSYELGEKTYQYALLIRFHRPIGTLLLLWPTLVALWIASDGFPEPGLLVIFVLGTFLMRSAGCAINDVADRNIDPHVSRTKNRPLAQGKIQTREAVIVATTLALFAFGLVLFLNTITVLLSLVGVLLATIYPFAKRYTYFPQVFLGGAYAWGVPMAFAAVTGSTPKICWLLYIAAVLWPLAYDTIYAMIDREDDIKIGVKSTAILFGEADIAIIGALQALVLATYFLIGQQLEFGIFYYLGLLVATSLAAYQLYEIRHREPTQCMAAFLQNNWLGLAIFAGVATNFAFT